MKTAPAIVPPRLPVQADGFTRLLPLGSVLYVRADGSRLSAIDREGTEHRVRATLDTLTARLVRRGFFRAHRAYLVNLAHVVGVVPYSRNAFALTFNATGTGTDPQIPLSKHRLAALRDAFGVDPYWTVAEERITYGNFIDEVPPEDRRYIVTRDGLQALAAAGVHTVACLRADPETPAWAHDLIDALLPLDPVDTAEVLDVLAQAFAARADALLGAGQEVREPHHLEHVRVLDIAIADFDSNPRGSHEAALNLLAESLRLDAEADKFIVHDLYYADGAIWAKIERLSGTQEATAPPYHSRDGLLTFARLREGLQRRGYGFEQWNLWPAARERYAVIAVDSDGIRWCALFTTLRRVADAFPGVLDGVR